MATLNRRVTKHSEHLEILRNRIGDSLLENESLSRHTSFRIGGPAEFFLVARNMQNLLGGIGAAKSLKMDYFILGGGSNILIGDNGVPGLVIKNECDNYLIDGETLTAQTGMLLDRLVDISCKNSFSGLEFAAGIRGTIGGAVSGNAGAFGGSISDVLLKAVVLTEDNKIESVDKDYFDFKYRHSKIKGSGTLVISAELKLKKGDKSEISSKINKHRKLRTEKHPVKLPSAGSFFKNFKNPALSDHKAAAGWYLEQVGAKKIRVGDAGVFDKHANIFVNYGKATAGEIVTMASELKKRVLDTFGMNLIMEVRPVGDFGEYRELLNTIVV